MRCELMTAGLARRGRVARERVPSRMNPPSTVARLLVKEVFPALAQWVQPNRICSGSKSCRILTRKRRQVISLNPTRVHRAARNIMLDYGFALFALVAVIIFGLVLFFVSNRENGKRGKE
jgi:hypothetical protein